VSPVEELRWLEYGQRLHARHRNIAVRADSPSVGDTLLQGALASGARATGQAVGSLRGDMADSLLLDADASLLVGAHAGDLADHWIFSGNRPLLREVHVGGRQVVAEGRHAEAGPIAAAYAVAMRRLLAEV